MNKKILVVSTSLRKNSNSEAMADEFAKGAQSQGHIVEKVSLKNKEIKFCTGCLSCQKTMKCNIKDDAQGILDKMLEAEVIVFATPVYFYDMCGQMKTLLDRSNVLFPADYAFREIYLIATAADTEDCAIDGTLSGLNGWIECYEKAQLAAVLLGAGLTEVGEAQENTELLSKAFELGKAV